MFENEGNAVFGQERKSWTWESSLNVLRGAPGTHPGRSRDFGFCLPSLSWQKKALLGHLADFSFVSQSERFETSPSFCCVCLKI